ncbi:SulP family inorganic anion transporter [Hyalangium versicolor]|uniref:SulP family inorganic anion transporter n=1 Tax=Hyalangium versicolor TaxID=2861190 RepID=UPI001CCFE720|nr:SulP family inorganic anion transporter [Hyalangium versicolor]
MNTASPEVNSSGAELSPLKNLAFDVPAGLVVFLVALPLCLGIALASGAPLLSGLVAGIIGGLIIPLISRSPLSVCGPAAGLATIVLAGITKVGSFQAFAVAVVIAGVLQLLLGISKAGRLVSFMPSSVIKGMLAAIGVLLILKQLPHALGLHGGKLALPEGGLAGVEKGALLLGVLSLALLVGWEKFRPKRLALVPGALVVVVVATLLNELFLRVAPGLALGQSFLVTIPLDGPSSLLAQLSAPDWSVIRNPDVWVLALTLGVVASLETLLSLEAVDRLDPYHRRTPLNRELVAQGLGNTVSGLLGGLPVTSVIVRSSANIHAGGRTQASTMVHGALLLGAVLLASGLLNRIPLASLAAILLATGYKLAKPALFREMQKLGVSQLGPFVATLGAILVTDLLRGIFVGVIVSVVFALRNAMRTPYTLERQGEQFVIKLKKDVYFFNKASLQEALEGIPEGARVVVDGSRSDFIDHDIVEVLGSFSGTASRRNIQLEVREVGRTPAIAT